MVVSYTYFRLEIHNMEYLIFIEVWSYLFVDIRTHSQTAAHHTNFSLHFSLSTPFRAHRTYVETSAFAQVSLRQVAETRTALQLNRPLASCEGEKRIFQQRYLTSVFAVMRMLIKTDRQRKQRLLCSLCYTQ